MDSTLFTTKKSELTDKISASSQQLLGIQSISLSFAYPIKPLSFHSFHLYFSSFHSFMLTYSVKMNWVSLMEALEQW